MLNEKKQAVGRITEPRIHTYLFVDENGQRFASVEYELCRNSVPFIRQFTTTLTKSATSTAEEISNLTAPLLSRNGVNSVRSKGRFIALAEDVSYLSDNPVEIAPSCGQ